MPEAFASTRSSLSNRRKNAACRATRSSASSIRRASSAKMVSSSEFPARFAHASAIVKTPRRACVAKFSIPSAYCTFALKPFELSGKLSGNGLALCGTVSRKPRASTPARRAGDRVDSLSCCNSASEAFSASNCTAVWRTKLSPFSASRKIASRGKFPHLSKSPISAA